MKNVLKEQYAKEIIELLQSKGVADEDKSKVFSCAYGIVREKVVKK
jgi:hypothetical protein